MDRTSSFRERLKRRRQELGLTQEALGERAGYAGQTIRKIEGGQRRPSYQLAARLADALAIPPDDRSAWMAAARAAEAELAEPELEQPLSATPQSLPVYLTPFVGRQQEHANVTKLLERPECRLITLLGPGGVGKTRLAVELARANASFRDGVAFVSLASVAVPAAIVLAIGDAVGLMFSGAGDLLAQLLSHLRDRHLLLVLDNLEHLLDPDSITFGLLGQILAQAPSVTVLATSRERLKLAGEWVVEIEGLPLPPSALAPKRAEYPALTLFVEHARRAQHAFRLTPENQRAVAAICRLVDGLPLGIELAAAWVRLLSPEEIGQELMRDLDTRHLSPGALPPRHHSLHSVVDHSWRLLGDEERQSLRRLSIFHGGFTREAAREIAGASLSVLASLADKSLLRRAAGARYDLHEIIRQYAAARLREDTDDLALTSDRHAEYYTRLLAEREIMLKGARQAAITAELSTEIDNIRAAWQWAVARGWRDSIVCAGETLQWFCEFRSWYQEGAELFATAAAQLRTAAPSSSADDNTRTLGIVLSHYGFLVARLGAFERAGVALAESLALLGDGRDPLALARTLVHQGIVSCWTGDYSAAQRALAQSLALATGGGNAWMVAMCQSWTSIVAHALGDMSEAERLFRAALAGWRALGSPSAIIWCITSCSTTLIALSKYEEAATLLRESLMLSHTIDDRYGMAMALHHLGLVAMKQQNGEEAVYLFREALALVRTIGSWEVAQTLNDLASALWSTGATEAAERTYHEALAAALQAHAPPDALQAVAGLAAVLQHRGHSAEALGLALRALAEPASRNETRRQAEAICHAARSVLSAEQIDAVERRSLEVPLEVTFATLAVLDPSRSG